MKGKLQFLSAIFLVFFLVSPAQATETTTKLKMTNGINMSTASVTQGSRVTFSANVTNTSPDPLTYSFWGVGAHDNRGNVYNIHISDSITIPAGKTVTLSVDRAINLEPDIYDIYYKVDYFGAVYHIGTSPGCSNPVSLRVNPLVIDGKKPTIDSLSGLSGPLTVGNSSTVNITIGDNINLGSLALEIKDGAGVRKVNQSWAASGKSFTKSYNFSTNGWAIGQASWKVTATDAAGNTQAQSGNFTLNAVPPPGPVCDCNHLNLCDTSQKCTNAGGYWYNNQCNDEPQPVYSWRASGFGACPAGCGKTAQQTQIVDCVDGNGNVVNSGLCPVATKPPTTQTCNGPVCPVDPVGRWELINCTSCDAPCDSTGSSICTYACVSATGVALDERYCADPMPSSVAPCDGYPCATSQVKFFEFEFLDKSGNPLDLTLVRSLPLTFIIRAKGNRWLPKFPDSNQILLRGKHTGYSQKVVLLETGDDTGVYVATVTINPLPKIPGSFAAVETKDFGDVTVLADLIIADGGVFNGRATGMGKPNLIPSASVSAMNAAGYERLFITATFDLDDPPSLFVANPADVFMYSGHGYGFSCPNNNGFVDLFDDNEKGCFSPSCFPSDINPGSWRNVKTMIFACCSMVNPDQDYGRSWFSKGPRYFLGYNNSAPGIRDQEIDERIIRSWYQNQKVLFDPCAAWIEANRVEYAKGTEETVNAGNASAYDAQEDRYYFLEAGKMKVISGYLDSKGDFLDNPASSSSSPNSASSGDDDDGGGGCFINTIFSF